VADTIGHLLAAACRRFRDRIESLEVYLGAFFGGYRSST
jgi:hypothetical protein